MIEEKGFHRLSYDKRLIEMEKYCVNLPCIKSKPPLQGGPIEKCSQNPFFTSKTDARNNGEICYKVSQNGRKPTKADKVECLSIDDVFMILDRISIEDSKLLGFPEGSHPRNLIMKGILVVPIIARPPVIEGGSIHYDQITHMYIIILKKAIELRSGKVGAQKELYTAVKQLIFKTEGKHCTSSWLIGSGFNGN